MPTNRKPGNPGRPAIIRYRLSVPESDVDVIEWIMAQANLSISMRALIKRYVAEEGIRDAFCSATGLRPRRGTGRQNDSVRWAADEYDGEDRRPARRSARRSAPVRPEPEPEQGPAPVAQEPAPAPVPQETRQPAAPVQEKPAAPIETDEDGFIDPGSFFG